MLITPKGAIKHNKLISQKSHSREQKLNMWVFTTLSKYSDLDQKFLLTYLERAQDSLESVLEIRDYFWNMVNRQEITEATQ